MMLNRNFWGKILMAVWGLLIVSPLSAQSTASGKPRPLPPTSGGNNNRGIRKPAPNAVTIGGKTYHFSPTAIKTDTGCSLMYAIGKWELQDVHLQMLNSLSRDYSYNIYEYFYTDVPGEKKSAQRVDEVEKYMMQNGYTIDESGFFPERLAGKNGSYQIVVVKARDLVIEASERIKKEMAAMYQKEQEEVQKDQFAYSGTFRSFAPPATSSYKPLKDYINANNNCCKGGSLTDSGKGIVLKGKNGASWNDLDSDLVNTIRELNNRGTTITDICITESGKFILLYGNNGNYRSGCPSSMVQVLKEKNSRQKSIYSVSMNDQGAWSVVHEDGYSADSRTVEFIRKATNKYGRIISVSIAEHGKVACCENGVYYEDIPQNLMERLQSLSFRPRVVKFTSKGLFLITDGDCLNTYFM